MFVQVIARANGTVLRPFPQPETPLSSQDFGLRLQVQAPGFELSTPKLVVERSNPSAIHVPQFCVSRMFGREGNYGLASGVLSEVA